MGGAFCPGSIRSKDIMSRELLSVHSRDYNEESSKVAVCQRDRRSMKTFMVLNSNRNCPRHQIKTL